MFKTTVLALAIGALPGLAMAADGPGCGAFSLAGGEKGVAVVDNPPEGKSIGDTRAGWRKLLDWAGAEVGEVHFVATLAAPEEAGHGDVLASQYFITLAGGWIATQSLYELPNAADTSQRAGNAVLVVTGGTGPFAGASGSVMIEAGDPPTYAFDVRCAK
jgi:hypothetical protein